MILPSLGTHAKPRLLDELGLCSCLEQRPFLILQIQVVFGNYPLIRFFLSSADELESLTKEQMARPTPRLSRAQVTAPYGSSIPQTSGTPIRMHLTCSLSISHCC
jgi:hypothetical protein